MADPFADEHADGLTVEREAAKAIDDLQRAIARLAASVHPKVLLDRLRTLHDRDKGKTDGIELESHALGALLEIFKARIQYEREKREDKTPRIDVLETGTPELTSLDIALIERATETHAKIQKKIAEREEAVKPDAPKADPRAGWDW